MADPRVDRAEKGCEVAGCDRPHTARGGEVVGMERLHPSKVYRLVADEEDGE